MNATIDQPMDHATLVLLDVAQEPLRKRIAELERIISRAEDALTTPYADDQERVENARRILEQG